MIQYQLSAIPPPFPFTWDLLARRRVHDTVPAVGYPVAISLYLGSFGTKTCPGYRVLAIPPPFPFTWDLLAQRRVRAVSAILPPFPITWDLLARKRVRDIGCRISRRHFPLPGIFWHEGPGYRVSAIPPPFPFTWDLLARNVSGISAVGYPAAISLYLGSFDTKTCPGYRL